VALSAIEMLTCLFVAGMVLGSYANYRIARRTKALRHADPDRPMSPGEKAGRDFSNRSRWMTDPAFRDDRRLIWLALAIIALAITGMILTGALTGQLRFG
jgi:hypothetical protein